MNKKILGIGAGVAALAAVGVVGYRHTLKTGPAPAAASAPETSRVISLGGETAPPVAQGKVLISPVTPKQMPPKLSDLKPAPATPPAAEAPAAKPQSAVKPQPKPGPSIAPVMPKAQSARPAATTQPAPAKAAAPKKKVISLSGDPQATASSAASSSKLTAQERVSLSLVKQLQQLRGGIGAWRARRGGEVPNFVANPMWEQFLRDESGRLAGQPPVNPLNGYSRVLPVSNDPAPGEAAGGSFGYVFAVNSGRLFATDAMGRVFDEAGVDPVGLESRAARELSPKDQEQYLLTTIDAVRGQVMKYALQHNNRPPDFARFPAFEQLMKPTLADGRPAEGGATGAVYGPYLLSTPINPFNGRHKVAVVPGELRPGMRIERGDAGFVYSTSTNKFCAIDAAGLVYDDNKARADYVPAEAGGTGTAASTGAADGAAIGALREYIGNYQRHHNGAVPDFKRYKKWEQLTGKTRADGKPDPAGLFGPYLFKIPVNSKNNSSEVDVVGRLQKGYKARKSAGYVFETSTGTIYLTDELGYVVMDQ